MIAVGLVNLLKVSRFVDFGAYLTPIDDVNSHEEILLPKRYIDENLHIGDKIKVFVYTDSEDRPVATTETPYTQVGEFAFLQATQVNRVGAFLDWGLQKNLLVPFKEQKMKMFSGGIYLVYVYLDKTTGRVVASAKIEKFLGNLFPSYKRGDSVKALIIGKNEIGYQAIVDNAHRGLLYFNEVFQSIKIGDVVGAWVKNVRGTDSKIDLTLTSPVTLNRIVLISEQILNSLCQGPLYLTDNSTPEEIKETFHCSKKDFKKAVGLLYKNKKIIITDRAILLADYDQKKYKDCEHI